MQDSDSDGSDYPDPTLDDHDEGGSSSGGVADKEMDDVPPTTETLAKQAPPPVSIKQPLKLGQILARLVVGQEENQKCMERQDKHMERQERCLKASIDKQAESLVLLKEQMSQQSSAFCEAINQ